MATSARILADSVYYDQHNKGHRLTTFEVIYQRFIHSELMTHRALSRNSGSSRAIPIEKMLDRIVKDPAMPVYWGSNRPGMQAGAELDGPDLRAARIQWLLARDSAVEHAWKLHSYGLHKQLVNRVVEPWMWITVLVTATDFANFFTQRCHPDAQPEIRLVAELMKKAYNESVPREAKQGEWHVPLIQNDEIFSDLEELKQISVARCARVSYLTHNGERDHSKDIELYNRLVSGGANGHWSPFEHVATPDPDDEYCGQLTGNFTGWRQFRKYFPQENIDQPSYLRPDVPAIELPDSFLSP